jgi:hypothetical protein
LWITVKYGSASKRFELDLVVPSDFISPKRFQAHGSLLGISLMDAVATGGNTRSAFQLCGYSGDAAWGVD